MISRLDSDLPEDEAVALARSAKPVTDLTGIEPAEPELVPSADGGIERMLFTVPGYAAEDEQTNPLAAVYRDLWAKLPDGIELVILTHRSVSDTVRSWLAGTGVAGAEVVDADDFVGFSTWAEDGYVGIRTNDRAALVEPAYFPRRGDALVADYVGAAGDIENFQAPLYFQGGNVLVGDEFFLIGIDYPIRTLQQGIVDVPGGQSPGELLAELYRRFFDRGRPPVFVGATVPVPAERTRQIEVNGEPWTESIYRGNAVGTRQPLFHIDMFISLAGRGEDGRYRVLVGDPREAAELLGEELRPEAMAEVFDNIARQLSRDFDVIRNPLPLTFLDFPEYRERLWYFATANNALVHRPAAGSPIAFLPSYGHGSFEKLRATDDRNRQVWEGLGFEVRMLADFHYFAVNLGAVHCIKKYLGRA
jgi:hypothetical protein